jgi:hypothetical protein
MLEASRMHKAIGESEASRQVLETLLEIFQTDRVNLAGALPEMCDQVYWRTLVELAPYRFYQGDYFEGEYLQRVSF